VATDWTLSPRYGFLSDFAPDEKDSADRLFSMNKFHINAIQFYDWLYRHDTLLPPTEKFLDPLGRRLSLKTIRNTIDLAHQYNMAAMAYTSVYGASKEFYPQHKDWALYRADGKPWTLDLQTYGDFLYIMNPKAGTSWRKHLLKQFQAALDALNFDGIHIDQYGDPRFAFDKEGNLIALAPAFASFIDATKETLCGKRSDAKVVFNAVNNWPIQAVAPANQDIVYVEVWPPHVTYQDLAAIIDQGRRLSGGKKVVLAAYIPPAWEASVRLVDAVIFANGGFHIEIGELNGMLSDPYFPKYQPMEPQLVEIMRGYYDFLVRYGEILHNSVEDTDEFSLFLDNIWIRDRAEPDTIWAIAKRKENLLMINLINLLGVGCLWREEQPSPRILKNIQAKLLLPGSERVAGIYLASPDFNHGRAVPLPFEKNTGSTEFIIPHLDYWDLLIVALGRKR
jgi:dextranase